MGRNDKKEVPAIFEISDKSRFLLTRVPVVADAGPGGRWKGSISATTGTRVIDHWDPRRDYRDPCRQLSGPASATTGKLSAIDFQNN